MPRINHVEKARKAIGQCGKCSVKIEKGDSYYWLAFRYGGKRVRCSKPECRFMRSDTTQSKLAAAYSAQEDAEKALTEWDKKDRDALREIVTDCGERVREVLDEYQSAADEHPNLAGQTEEIRSSLEDICESLESFDPDEHDPDAEPIEKWAERVLGEAEDAIERVSEV